MNWRLRTVVIFIMIQVKPLTTISARDRLYFAVSINGGKRTRENHQNEPLTHEKLLANFLTYPHWSNLRLAYRGEMAVIRNGESFRPLWSLHILYLALTGGGQCLSHAQQVTCSKEMTRMVEAEENGDGAHTCRTFGDLHTCILQAMSTCPYNSKERKLYEMDIVEHYVKKPFSCALIGGNLEYKAEYTGGGNKQASIYTMIHTILYVTYKTVTF